MRFLVSLLLIALFTFIAGLFLPWWSIAIVAFLGGLLVPQSLGRSFLAGFFGVLLPWGILAALVDVSNNHVLSVKIARLFKLGDAWLLLIFITAFVGALVGGFAALSGASLRPARRTRTYA
jgi:hypothetical protein